LGRRTLTEMALEARRSPKNDRKVKNQPPGIGKGKKPL